MTDFLSASLCRGDRPRQLSSVRVRSRSDLMARLLRERHVARFLVAPGGYGKSSLACSYAEIMFSFEHVFWVDGRSPCFLRDLDQGRLAERLLACDPQARLVVFDDVPRIDTGRADAFSLVVDQLLEASCEVLVALCPSNDAYGRRQPDRIRLGALDLVLSNDELASASHDRALPMRDSLPLRVPVLAWGGEDRCDVLLDGLMREELPSELMLGAFALLVLVEGRLADAGRIAPVCLPESAVALADDYSYLGIDLDSGEFAAVQLPVARLVQRVSSRLGGLAAAAGCEGKDAFLLCLADVLLAAGNAQRACELVLSGVTRSGRADWLCERDDELLRAGVLATACQLFSGLRVPRDSRGAMLRLGQARRLALLEDAPRAIAEASRVLTAPSAVDALRAQAALLVLDAADAGEQAARARALGVLEQVQAQHASCEEGCASPSAGPPVPELAGELLSANGVGERAWMVPAGVRLALERSPGQALAVWEAWRAAPAERRALHDAAVLMLADPAELERRDLCRLAEFLCASLDELAEHGDALSPAELAAERCLKAAHALDPAVPLPSPFAAAALQRAAENLREQQRMYRQALSDAASAPPSGARAADRVRSEQLGYPELRVRLFGGIDVQIGDARVDPSHFRRQKVKTLLVLLVVNAGRELPRDRLVEDLWPASPLETARRNLYTIWSELRRALTTADGQCPYLVRMQNGYKLDDRALSTDIRRVDELCRTLLVGRRAARPWSDVLAELNEAYAGDLLPSETVNETVLRLRDEYRTRVVDALVTASMRLADEGEVQGALWYARAAFERERTREDVYAALMRAQIDAGQRTMALDTYFACRSFLAKELGIDPSAATVRLYRSIIEEEEALEW